MQKYWHLKKLNLLCRQLLIERRRLPEHVEHQKLLKPEFEQKEYESERVKQRHRGGEGQADPEDYMQLLVRE